MTDWRDHDLTLARMAEQTCRRTARQELLVDHELRLTGEQTLDAAARFAGRLSSLGLARGSHVALLAPTGVRHMVAFLAAQRIGLVTCTLHAREPAGSLARLLDWVDADALVCHPQYQDKARASVAGSQRRPRLISLGDETAADFAFSWSEAASAAPAPAAPVREDDLAVIVLSSGSTGTAKGVLQTHRGVVASARNGQAFASDLGTQTTALISVASSFAAWLWGTTTVLYAGGKLVLWSGFDAAQFADMVGRERPDLVPMVPTMARLLPPEVDRDPRLASIRTVPLGGEAPSRADVERLLRWGARDVRAMYLSAESGRAASTWCSHREMLAGKWGSAGRVVPGAELRIVDPDGRIDAALPPGTVGEIALRGPSVARGYWKDAERTGRFFQDGWWRSGDLGYLDADGFLFIRGRLDNVINTGGIKVSGEEIEAALLRCPGVRQAVVVGEADERWGQRIVAHLVAPGLDAAAVERNLEQVDALAAFKRPKEFRFHESLPVGATGKLDRRALRSATRTPEEPSS